MKNKGKGCLKAFAIFILVFVLVLAAAAGIGWVLLDKEHREAASLPLNGVDFGRLQDGVYAGEYAGGMYQWRENQCQVTVVGGKMTEIELLGSREDPDGDSTYQATLYERAIAAQSLQVDVISGATLTSKAYLQCVENALLQAQ